MRILKALLCMIYICVAKWEISLQFVVKLMPRSKMLQLTARWISFCNIVPLLVTPLQQRHIYPKVSHIPGDLTIFSSLVELTTKKNKNSTLLTICESNPQTESFHKGLLMLKAFPCHHLVVRNVILHEHSSCSFKTRESVNLAHSLIRRFYCQKQVFRAWLSNCTPQFTVGCNCLFVPHVCIHHKCVLFCSRYIYPYAPG